MKKITTVLLATCSVLLASAQCFVQVTNQPASCFGACDGSANSFPVGTGPWNFLWTPGGMTTQNVTGLCAGTYTVQITSQTNGCTATAQTTITQPSQVTGSATAQPATSCINCNGMGSVSPSGGTGPYTFSWSPGNYTTQTVTGLCPGVYTVTITDANNCTGMTLVTVGGPPTPTATAQCTSATCFGGTDGGAMAIVTGGQPPYTYNWMPAGGTQQFATGLAAGCYTVIVTGSNGCTATASCCVTQPPQLNVNITANVPATCQTCCDGSATASGSGGVLPYTYMWLTSPTQNTATATGLCAGAYSVCVTDANGCTACTAVTVTYTVGTDEMLDANVSFYPNPASEELNVALDKDLSDAYVMIYNLLGEQVSIQKLNFIRGKSVKLDVRDLGKGLYFLEVRKGNMTVKKKFAKL